jgi:hypothetical protein
MVSPRLSHASLVALPIEEPAAYGQTLGQPEERVGVFLFGENKSAVRAEALSSSV